MHHARLDINILDLWLFGSGRGEGAHIDSTPLLDAKGLPYVRGRAVKGLLRDAARELLLLQSPGEQQSIRKCRNLPFQQENPSPQPRPIRPQLLYRSHLVHHLAQLPF